MGEEKLPIFDHIDEIAKNKFSKDWSQVELKKVEGPSMKEEKE